jgi:hypothetical protein
MKAISKRLGKLENRFGLGPETEPILLVLCQAGWGLALDKDRCIQIIRECGFLPIGPVGLVNLCQIPDGLNATELERYLRENGAETRGFRGAQNHGGQRAQASARLHECGERNEEHYNQADSQA